MLRLAFLLALTLALPALAQPPCTAPPGPAQAVICGDPGLRAADADLRRLEREVAALSPRPATLAARAAAWQRMIEAEPPRADTLEDHYASRLHEWRELLRQDRAIRRVTPLEEAAARRALEQRCLGQVLGRCRVVATGMVIGEDRAPRLLWQIQQGVTEADGLRAGILLLAEARGAWRPIAWAFEGGSYEAPVLHPQAGGVLLSVVGRRAGSDRANADLLFQQRPGGWREVEMESWREAAAARLPPGLEIRQAVAYEIGALAATARLSREADAICCASGGRATLGFRLEGPSLRLEAIELDETPR